MKITKIKACEVIDSRGNPTVSATVYTDIGAWGEAIVPSGASTGIYEAVEKRDKDAARFGGKGVLSACDNINKIIAPALYGKRCDRQEIIDNILINLDESENKGNLGANATLAVSLAAARAAANGYNMELFRYIGGIFGTKMPLPMMNILNGGAHADNNIDIQEFMIVPVGAECFSGGLMMCCEVYHKLKGILKARRLATTVGDEGGVAPNLCDSEAALALITDAIEGAGYNTDEIKIALDAASSEWYENGIYKMPKSGKTFSGDELVSYWQGLVDEYPIISLEDAAAEDDWETWGKITRTLRTKVQLVGDDLFVTNAKRLSEGIKNRVCNSILIKPNQIGTLSETLETISLAKDAGYGNIISHRSGESEDTFIADLAVGVSAGQIKTGAPCRGERTAKYNRLLKIERMIKEGF